MNEQLILFNDQTSNGTGPTITVHPDHPTDQKNFHLVLSGDLGGGALQLQVAFNELDFVDQLLNGEVFQQTVIGYDKLLASIDTPRFIRAVLIGATAPNLTAILYHKTVV